MVGLMATSGSTNYSQTRNEIISDALQLLGVYGLGRQISSEDVAFCSNMLNKMVKAWENRGLHLFTKTEGVLFVTDSTGQYTLSNAATSARATNWSDAVITQLSVAAASSATTLTVDSTTGMTAADIIGVVRDTDVITWTTIVSVDSSTGLTLTAGLGSAAAIDSNVYTFTSRINKPLRILSMRQVSGVDDGTTSGLVTETPLSMLSYSDFMDLPNKTINGTPTHYHYNPNVSDGTLYLYPRPDNPDIYFRMTYERAIEDFDSASNDADFPQEWLEVLTYQLAVRIAPAFGKDQKAISIIAPLAAQLFNEVLDYDAEVGSLYIQPDKGYTK